MDKYIEHIFDIVTGETSIIERDFTVDEIESRNKEIARMNILKELQEIDNKLNPVRLLEELLDANIPEYKFDLILRKKELREQLKNI